MNTSNTIGDMKFRVYSQQHSAVVQQHLFEHGYRWASGDQTVHTLDHLGLFVDSDTRTISAFVHASDWNHNDVHEVDVRWLDPAAHVRDTTVAVDGMVYNVTPNQQKLVWAAVGGSMTDDVAKILLTIYREMSK